jgi:hypothetical protein
LQLSDKLREVIRADDAFELESGTIVVRPDEMALDPADHGNAKSDPLTAFKVRLTLDHEALRRDVDQMQLQFAQLSVLANSSIIDWVTCGASHLGYGEPRSRVHAACLDECSCRQAGHRRQ